MLLDDHGDAHPLRPDRRKILQAAAVTGGVAWAAPAILSIDAAAAATCCTPLGPRQVITTCQNNTNQPNQNCTTWATGTTTVCRLRNQRVLFSRNNTGTQEPYPDEIVILTVTAPGGAVQIQNFIRWEADCRATNNTQPDVTLTGNNPCGTTTNPAIDITALFGISCGIFTVQAVVRNKFSPYAWSTMWIYPV